MNLRSSELLVLTLGLLPAIGMAQIRTSPGAVLTTDTVAVGGGLQTGPGIRAWSHLGSSGQPGSGPPPAGPALSKPGFAGQLYEVRSLEFPAGLSPINESASTPLALSALLDDQTRLSLPGASVAWTVVSGPIQSITAGVATAAAVYQDSAAQVVSAYRGATGTLALIVRNVNPDNYGSYAGDGLPDDWQVLHFGENNPLAAPNADPDGDAQNNQYENIVGTDPRDAASRFELEIARSAGPPPEVRLTFRPRLAGRTYEVETAGTPDAGAFSPLTGTTNVDSGDLRTVLDTNLVAGQKFYRVRVSMH